jgi:apolipoprotein N-acyltransferase
MNCFVFEKLRESLRSLPCGLKLLASLAAGIVMVPAMPPFGLWPLLLAGFPVFYVLLFSLRPGWRAFLAGWLFGFGYFAAGLYWIGNALLVPGNEFKWVWPLAIAGLPALLAFFTAFAAWGARRYGGDGTRAASYLAFCAAFGLLEWLRGWVFTGYPWNLYGYTWFNLLPVAQAAAFIGAYGLTLLTVMWAALPGYLWLSPRPCGAKFRTAALALVSFGLVLAFGFVRLDLHPTALRDNIVVRAVQPNIAQEDKWNPRKAVDNFQRQLMLSAPAAANADKTTVLVWPETAVPFYIMNDISAQAALRTLLAEYEMPVYLITGLLRAQPGATEKDSKFFNSLVVLNREGQMLGTYDKSHLVPFGEYIPFQKYVPFGPFVQFSGFEPGAGPQTMDVQGLPGFSPLICYEVIFPGGVTGHGKRPEWLVNITNDAWYGDSPGPRQHFAMAEFRAIEEGVPVVRAANTGISGVIDPVGRVIHKAPLMTENNDDVALPAPIQAAPPYARWGNLIFMGMLITLMGCTIVLRRVSEV